MRKSIGIDLGGTSISGGIVTEDGHIIKRAHRDTGKGVGSAEVLRRIALVISDLLEGEEVNSIGIGSPGFIDTENGRVLSIGGNIIGWKGTDIRGNLSKAFSDHEIYVGNDANLAGLCESWVGAGKDFESFVMLTLGTGLGGAIYTLKQGIWYGHNYKGAELGHAILYPNGKECVCGQRGCAERYVSGTGIELTYYDISGENKSGYEIFSLYDTDVNAVRTIETFADNLAIYISSLKNIFDPEGIVIGGGVINARDYWWDRMIDQYRSYVNDHEGMTIVPAIHLNDAGIIGAGKLALERAR